MSWSRGQGDTDYELARAQSWIERADIDLYGPDGDDGVIREHQNDRAARMQRDKDLTGLIKLIGWVLGTPLFVLLAMSIMRAIHWIS
jgi:hypothetical protein